MLSKHLELFENQMASLTLRSCFGILRRRSLEWFQRNFRKAWIKADLQAIFISIYSFIYKQKHVFVAAQSPLCIHIHPVYSLTRCSRIGLILSALASHFSSVCLHHLHPSLICQSNPFTPHLPADSPLNIRALMSVQLSVSPPPSLFSRVSLCDAFGPSGTSVRSHLKHFTERETHICCFRALKDTPWRRLFEVASRGEREPERRI